MENAIKNYEDVDSWKTIMFLYTSALKEVGTKLEILNDEFQHVHQYNPIEHIKTRVKTPESIVKKLRKYGYEISIENMVNSVFAGGELKAPANKSRILFIHGTKANEILSKKSARLMKKYYPETRIVGFKGSAHCYTMIYQPEQWIECVERFLQE